MTRFYADEQFPLRVVEHLRALGHNVLTVQEAGNANLKISDDLVLAFATSNNRVVLTLNRKDFKRLHRSQPHHAGIVICTDDTERIALAERIHIAIVAKIIKIMGLVNKCETTAEGESG